MLLSTYIDDGLLVDMGSSLTSFSTQLQPGTIIPDPNIVWTATKPKRLTLDEQCEAAMWRLKAHINSRCAEHRVAIQANSGWDVARLHSRHGGDRCVTVEARYVAFECVISNFSCVA